MKKYVEISFLFFIYFLNDLVGFLVHTLQLKLKDVVQILEK
jgi:hypothetical protein